MGMADPKDYLDRRYENAENAELPEAPVDALKGLGKAGSAALRKAIGVKTIRDLAENRFVLAAQEVVQLAEGVPASPSAATTSPPTSGPPSLASAPVPSRAGAPPAGP